jgi:hypothetical protein
MDIYRVVYDYDIDKPLEDINDFEGVYAISIVDDPANEKQFIAMSKGNKEIIKLANKDKQLLTGVVLIPNQKIFRASGDYEYYIYFDEETIEKLSQDFIRQNFHKNSTFNHSEKYLKGISVVESWIVTDPENDKANALGFRDTPKGTWMVTMKLSDELWEEYIKTGKAKGFSIDGFLDTEKIQMNNNNNKNNKKMSKKTSFLTKLRNAIAISLMKTISVDGMGELSSENFEMGDEVYFEGELLISTVFEYEGFLYTTDDAGQIISKEEKVVEVEMEEEDSESVEEMVEEMVEEIEDLLSDILDEVQMKKLKAKLAKKKTKLEEIAEEEAEEIEDIVEDIVEEVSDTEDVDVEALQELVEDLQEKVEELETENAELKANVAKLSKQPNTTKLKANVSNDVSVSETRMEKIARLARMGQKN